jgi:hypothetical protein
MAIRFLRNHSSMQKKTREKSFIYAKENPFPNNPFQNEK